MSWYDEAVFYHIYPLGLTGAPMHNDYGEVVHRLNTIIPWITHIREIGCNALYIGPLFQSVQLGCQRRRVPAERVLPSRYSYDLGLCRRKSVWICQWKLSQRPDTDM